MTDDNSKSDQKKSTSVEAGNATEKDVKVELDESPTAEEQEFIRKIRSQIALEDNDSATLIAAFLKNIP